MESNHIKWGEPLIVSTKLSEKFKGVLKAIELSAHFARVELRKIDNSPTEVVVVNVSDGSYGPKNKAGLKRTETIAITFSPSRLFPWEVRPLRRDFPVTLHQNQTADKEPKSLCLYSQSWKSVERSWTPVNFLQRILWWLRETANETLHKNDQGIEQLFYHNGMQLVLPHNFFDESSRSSAPYTIEKVDSTGTNTMTLIATKQPSVEKNVEWDHLCLLVPQIANMPVANLPTTLGSLHDTLVSRNSALLAVLINSIKQFFELPKESGTQADDNRKCLLILQVPRVRGENIERCDTLGFLIDHTVQDIGLATGALFQAPGDIAVYVDHTLNDDKDDWRHIEICPIEIKHKFTAKNARLMSGIDDEKTDIKGVLAGVGSLGSALANLWSRIGWGEWCYIDDDIIQPHNIVKHIANAHHIGVPKASLTCHLTRVTFEQDISQGFVADVTDKDAAIAHVLNDSDVIVDVTTTVYVPRELSLRNNIARTLSAFITPSGKSAVLLTEDSARKHRLANIEAQYYRAILNDDWGEAHLQLSRSQRVGGGCRDVSNIISYEDVTMFSAILSKQIRHNVKHSVSSIQVWHCNSDQDIHYNIINVWPHKTEDFGDWVVHWDDGFRDELQVLREKSLPCETGGVILGIVDTASKQIQLVIGLPAPIDSECSKTHFYRGSEGLNELICDCQSKTANMIGYVGEWHSHPGGHGATPSLDDVALIAKLTKNMQRDGLPALMVIISDDELTVSKVASL